jgi:hypothetical protein
MSRIYVQGHGAVSPAGWGVAAMREALARQATLPIKELARPGRTAPLRVRQVPAASPRPAFLAHARLRRTSPIAHYATAAALEALGEDAPKVAQGALKLGIVYCAMSGCVNYSRRFFEETLRDPATASPLVFPETVFNAPASHIAALLGTTAVNYTLIGDPATFLQGVALAADWLVDGMVDACLVLGAEEVDWMTADACQLFSEAVVLSDGAGALYLKRGPALPGAIELRQVTDPFLYLQHQPRARAVEKMQVALAVTKTPAVLCDSRQGVARLDAAELAAWHAWNGGRVSPKQILGEGLMAAAAWQCVAAVDELQQKRYAAANVSLVGCNQQAIGARFEIDG